MGLDYSMHVLSKDVLIDKAELIVNDQFSVPETCNYSFQVRLPNEGDNSKNSNGAANQSMASSRGKAITAQIQVFRLQNGEPPKLASLNEGVFGVHGWNPRWTYHLLDNIKLYPGKHLVKVELIGHKNVPVPLNGLFTVTHNGCNFAELKENTKGIINERLDEIYESGRLNQLKNITGGEYEGRFDRHIDEIVAREIVLGMSPYEAYLAGGRYTYEVRRDAELWDEEAHPERVIKGQNYVPDNSEIEMFFANQSQFPKEGVVEFKVSIRRGVVTQISRLD